MDERENRLAATTSPYLQQHARNPVDWYPWGEEALSRARAEDKPILLSVGYSACHWCHVMAHESFEDDETAALMNREFINIKVDREERPDIDAIYQKVVQLMGQGGGWPLTVFLTPDQRPFYGGTYFPPEPNFGRPGFRQVLVGLADAYRNEPAKIRAQAQRFVDGIAALGELLVDPRQEGGDALADRPGLAAPQALTGAGGALLQHHDPRWGGFGSAPKFPCPTALELWLACAKATSDAPLTGLKGHAATALRRTLEMMWRGGMYDHLRGGFSRYSVDPYWRVPHFEKMLYDNAQLLALYAEASALWPEDAWLWRVVVDTIDYLEADMRAPSGAFYAATDADSEGVEGKYFTWSFEQLTEALDDPALAARIARVYGVTGAGTFEHGLSVLQRQEPLAALAPALGVPEEALAAELEAARARLLARRYTRVPPGLDDKVLTSWNALLISGLCRAAAVAEARGEEARAERVRALAVAALDTLLKEHVQEDGSVLRASFRGRAHTRGFLDDVAGLARACLDVHEHTLDPALLAAARRLAAHFLAHHAREGGGFYLSADDAEPLLDRSEQAVDSASPSGAGVALEVLLRLEADGALDDAPELAGARAHVAATLERLAALVDQPLGGASLIRAAQHRSPDAIHVTVRGEGAATLAAAVRRARLELPGPITLTRGPDVGETSAIVCRGQVCTAPLLEVTELARALSRRP